MKEGNARGEEERGMEELLGTVKTEISLVHSTAEGMLAVAAEEIL